MEAQQQGQQPLPSSPPPLSLSPLPPSPPFPSPPPAQAQFTSLTCSNSSAALEQESVAGSSAGSSPGSTTSLLRWFDDGPDEPLPWECTMDDTLPTLDAVFRVGGGAPGQGRAWAASGGCWVGCVGWV